MTYRLISVFAASVFVSGCQLQQTLPLTQRCEANDQLDQLITLQSDYLQQPLAGRQALLKDADLVTRTLLLASDPTDGKALRQAEQQFSLLLNQQDNQRCNPQGYLQLRQQQTQLQLKRQQVINQLSQQLETTQQDNQQLRQKLRALTELELELSQPREPQP